MQRILQRENAWRSDNPSRINRQEVWDRILATSEALGELKARSAWIQQLTLREGEEVQMLGRDHEKLTFRWESFIGQGKQDQLVADLRKQIEELQDKVDAYNATTEL